MNARIFLLVLVSAAFMKIWDADQQAMQTALARRDARVRASELASSAGAHSIQPETPAQELLQLNGTSSHGEPACPDAQLLDTLPLDLQTTFVLATTIPNSASALTAEKSSGVSGGPEKLSGVVVEPSIPVTPLSAALESDVTERSFRVSLLEPALVAMETGFAAPVLRSFISLEIQPALIPVPETLAAGTWQATSQSGQRVLILIERTGTPEGSATDPTDHRVQEINTSEAIAEGSVSTVSNAGDRCLRLEQSFCVAAAPGGIRWCFIRVDKIQAELVEATSVDHAVSVQ